MVSTKVWYSATTSSLEVLAALASICLLYTSDAADERSSVDLGGRRIIKKKKKKEESGTSMYRGSITQRVKTKKLATKRTNEKK